MGRDTQVSRVSSRRRTIRPTTTRSPCASTSFASPTHRTSRSSSPISSWRPTRTSWRSGPEVGLPTRRALINWPAPIDRCRTPWPFPTDRPGSSSTATGTPRNLAFWSSIAQVIFALWKCRILFILFHLFISTHGLEALSAMLICKEIQCTKEKRKKMKNTLYFYTNMIWQRHHKIELQK